MLPFCTFDTIADELRAARRSSWDALCTPSDLAFEDGRLLLYRPGAGRAPVSLTPWAEGQLLARFGIPAGYFRRCPASLRDAQFSYWMDRLAQKRPGPASGGDETRFLVRGHGGSQDHGGTVRGVLSERYTRIDNDELLEAVRPLLGLGLTLKSCEVTDQSFHLRLIAPGVRAEAYRGDPLFAGIHVANSEVGMRTLSVDALVYRLVCTNGLVALTRDRGVYRRRHSGSRPADLSGELLVAATAALSAGGRAALALDAAREHRIEDPAGRVRELAKAWDLADGARDDVLAQLGYTEGGRTNLFELVNAVTAVARGQTPDERLRMETLAGGLLN